MLIYTHVEDYLEVLAGFDHTNGIATLWAVPDESKIIINDKRDYNLIESLANQVVFGSPLTDRQGPLACQLLLKYRDKLRNAGIDVDPIENPQYRQPLRIINRRLLITINNDKIAVYFPWNKQCIEDIQLYKQTSMGSVSFDYDNKVWNFGLTEANLMWAVVWGNLNRFIIDNSVLTLYDKLIECENTPYSIKLVSTLTGYTIENASQSLIDYVDTHLGGRGFDNLNTLVDYAGILGYEVDEEVRKETKPSIRKFGLTQSYYLAPTADNLTTVLDYAIETNRFPIVIYHPAGAIGNALDMSILHEMFSKDEIVHINYSGKIQGCVNWIDSVKIIYVEKLPKKLILDKIPLLVTYQELLHGSNKQSWLNSAERIIYLCNSKLRKN
jgi:hypothetical protein